VKNASRDGLIRNFCRERIALRLRTGIAKWESVSRHWQNVGERAADRAMIGWPGQTTVAMLRPSKPQSAPDPVVKSAQRRATTSLGSREKGGDQGPTATRAHSG